MTDGMVYEIVDGPELGHRWVVPATWIRHHTQRDAKDPIPCIRLGKYVRFEWNSPQLNAWWARRRTGKAKN
jgi:hypothetical protein